MRSTKTIWRKFTDDLKRRTVGPMAMMALAVAIAFVAAALTPTLAYAQQQPNLLQGQSILDFEPQEGDLTNWVTRKIFGDFEGGDETALSGPMRTLNMFALAFGTLMFTFVAVVGTLNSAQDGRLLGNRWSSMWVPMRFILGAAMLVPLSSGYSTAQHLVIKLGQLGGGAASQVWSSWVGAYESPSRTLRYAINGEDQLNAAKTLARDILQAEVCVASMNRRYEGRASFGVTVEELNQDGSTSKFKHSWGGVAGSGGFAADHCGSVTTSAFVVPTGGEILSPESPYQTTSLAEAGSAYAQLARAQSAGVAQATARARVLANRIVADGDDLTPGFVTNAVTQIASAYRGAMAGAASDIAGLMETRYQRFLRETREQGWIMSAASFYQKAQVVSEANKALSAIPEFSRQAAPTHGIYDAPFYEDMRNVQDRIDEQFKAGGEWELFGVTIPGGRHLAQNIAEYATFDPENTDHALVQLKNQGDRIIGATAAAYTAFVATNAAAAGASESWVAKGARAVVGSVFDAKSAASVVFASISPIIKTIFIALFSIGVTMAFVLPMLPFVYSIGAILGWLMALFSAVVATPIWMAGHLNPEGDGFAPNRAMGGYMILLETVTRPIFMVFGLIGAFVIMDPMLRMTSWLFNAQSSSLQSNSFTGLISMVIIVVIYVAIAFTVIRMSTTMVYALSEKVYTWIGGTHAGYEQAREFGSAGNQAIGASTGQIRGSMEGAAAAALSTRNKQIEEAKKARAAEGARGQ